MPVTSVVKDEQALTITVHSEFPVPVARLWDAYLDPRQIEKFWGPVGYPATFARHDGAPGGRTNYWMTSPEGERFHGFWNWTEVVEHKFFEVVDGFANPDATPNEDLPTGRMVFTFDPTEAGSKLTITQYFSSVEDLEQVVEMGQIEGMQSAMGQIEQVLVDLRDYSRSFATEVQVLSDTQVRIARLVRGTREQVWRAHHDADLIRRWMLGPDGWRMTECEPPAAVGDSYRFWWEPEPGVEGEGFGFTGVCLADDPPSYSSTTEQMIGTEYPPTTNELTLTPVQGGTLVSTVITYPDSQTRDIVLATGMADGMEASFSRLETLL